MLLLGTYQREPSRKFVALAEVLAKQVFHRPDPVPVENNTSLKCRANIGYYFFLERLPPYTLDGFDLTAPHKLQSSNVDTIQAAIAAVEFYYFYYSAEFYYF
jgi:hypothetical protein